MKKTVAVIFGGRSAEHDVSIITGYIPIITALQASGQYNVVPVYITPEGPWYSTDGMSSLNFFQQPNFRNQLSGKKQLQFSFDDGLKLIWPGLRPRIEKIDVAFPAMHGTYGEDGTLMGMLRLANVPFVGCDLEASAIAMDKVLTRVVAEARGIPTTPAVWFTAQEWALDAKNFTDRINKGLKYPLFVKPVHLGSSIAITRVAESTDLLNAIELALHYDDKIVVEQGVENLIEVTLPIIGNDELQLAHIEQPLAGFFDFEEKYLKGGKKGRGGVNSQYSNIPAKISDKLAERVRDLGRATYRAIGASGIARVDFLINSKTDEVFLIEVNTLPGSLYVHNWKQAGVSSVQLVTKLIELAQERHEARQKLAVTFHSDILQKVSGAKFQ
ncbi:MAG TPA: D-alanine--D-alanine ligase family protein [Candidatus Saccharimonadia bacterium]|nr:D-alanine--D-alanine ligase family protein [Candidatus Saccharimonadia bacterium]